MNDVGSSWLMTSLTPSPLWVAMVQAATTLPMFLFALPAGAMADIIDRRKLLIVAQLLILVGATALTIVHGLGHTTPIVLLVLTAVMGTGAAFSAPAFQATVPELVDKSVLADAIALNSLGVNVSRAIGPALGGLLVATAGVTFVYALNAVSILAVLGVLIGWRRQHVPAALPPEHLFNALRTGYRYARHAPALQRVILRSIAFFLFASGLWALLPIIGRRTLGLDAAGYGALLGCMGAGAVAGALILSRLRKHITPNQIAIGASLIFALATLVLSRAGNVWIAGIIMLMAGFAWIAMLSTLNVAAQVSVPMWVRARALAVYLLVFQGAMTLGSVVWGSLASRLDTPTSLTIAAALMVIASLIGLSHPLPKTQTADLAPSGHWAEPSLFIDLEPDQGPVMITIEYHVASDQRDNFLDAIHHFKAVRKRDGALRWDIYEDSAAPNLFVETFLVASWLEHLRQHARITHEDQHVQERLNDFLTTASPPRVRHLVTAQKSDLMRSQQPLPPKRDL